MEQEIREIASRIKELREVCGYSREELAKELGLDVATYSRYEEVGDDIPINIIYHIANLFGVNFTEILTGDSPKLTTYHLVKRGTGLSVDRYPGYNFEDLAYRFNHKIMQPLLVTLDPSDEPAALVRHAGQEFNMVLEGSVKVTIGKTELVLTPGDCVYFDPRQLHGQSCVGAVKARFLTVIAE